MKKARLKKLVNHLYKVGLDIATGKLVDKFDMSTWGELEEGGVFKARKDMSCMTAACAIGHAGAIFKTEGFKLALECEESEGEEIEYCTNVIPEYRGQQGFEAVAAFFQISIDEAEYLFAPEHYNKYNLLGAPVMGYKTGPGEVADRIRAFIEDN